MKKLLILAAFLVHSFAGTAFAYDSPSFDGWTDKSKDRAQQGNPVRVLKLVRNSSQTVNAGVISTESAVVYDTISDDGVTVRMASASADGAFAGIAVTQIQTADTAGAARAQDDAGKRNWGWILVHGPTTVLAIAGGTNGHGVGDPFITSDDAGTVTSLELAGTNYASGVFSGTGVSLDNSTIRREIKAGVSNGGFFMDVASATATTYDVFVNVE